MNPIDNYHRSQAVKILSQLVDTDGLTTNVLISRATALIDQRNPAPMNEVFAVFAKGVSSGRFKNVVFTEDANQREVLQGFLLKIKHDNGTVSQLCS